MNRGQIERRQTHGFEAHFASCGRFLGAKGIPCTIWSRISLVRTGHAWPSRGVMLSCSDWIMGSASLGPGIWLSAVQMPAGGAVVSMNPMPAITGALMWDAKLTGSKYRAVFMMSGLSD